MLRRIGALAILLACLVSFGCALCAAPDDYCGPIPEEGLGFNDRAGSVLSGQIYEPGYDMPVEGGMIDEGMYEEVAPPAPIADPAMMYGPRHSHGRATR